MRCSITDTTTKKRCPRCKKHLPLDKFGANVRSPDGKHYYCRTCASSQHREYYAKNRSKCLAYNRTWLRHKLETCPDYNRERHAKAQNRQLEFLFQQRVEKRYAEAAEALLKKDGFKSSLVKRIWQLHVAGLSIREIAKKVEKNKDSTVHRVIKQLRGEMIKWKS